MNAAIKDLLFSQPRATEQTLAGLLLAAHQSSITKQLAECHKHLASIMQQPADKQHLHMDWTMTCLPVMAIAYLEKPFDDFSEEM